MSATRTKTSTGWLVPAVLLVTVMCSPIAEANELTGAVSATPAAPDSRNFQAEVGLSPRSARGEESSYAVRRLAWRNTKAKREEEKPRLREAAAASWRYTGRLGTALILGVGF
jgi:hypothetical protein